ncbi:MAG: N-acetyl-gamma-glutamyl-phosphate reductase [Euryarchaeota archaeon]|nr:N-acetyl-gamma-glutamyl-phosphate reductase [Euryarchaeota archaeon]
MAAVGIIGGSGYTGGELLRILARHSQVEVACVTSREHAGRPVHKVHPNLRRVLELSFEAPDYDRVAERCDLVFCATPHGVSMQVVPLLLERGVRVVDLSGDFRFGDVAVYERYYGRKHVAPEVRGVYGLPELYRKEIEKAELVANPGCYPTAVILGLVPLLRGRTIDPSFIVADAKSGISGAGNRPRETTHFPNAAESVLAYRVASHQHLPEIEQELQRFSSEVRVSFVPHIVPVIRGLTATLHCQLTRSMDPEEVRELYVEFYRDEPFVRVLEAGEVPRLSAVRGSNFIDIGAFAVDEERGRVVVVAAIDNLVKGASGQAVQNMNIMLGFSEEEGLRGVAIHP